VDRWWSLSGALMMVFYSPAVGLLLPLRLDALHAPAAWFGLCQAGLALGVLSGVLGAAERLIRRLGRHRAMMMAVLLCGLCIGAMAACSHPVVLVVLMTLIGACTSLTQLTGQTVRALAVPDDFRARMSAAQLTLSALAGTAAPLVAGAMLQRWPIDTVYALQGAGFLFAGLVLLIVPGLRTLLSLSATDAVGWYERRYPQAFRRDASPNRHRCP
jgi:MFS family permease